MAILSWYKDSDPDQGTFTTLSILFALVVGFVIAMVVLRVVY